MSVGRLRARVDEAERALQSHGARTRSQAARLKTRLHRLWPWLWMGSGATLGVLAEQRMSSPPADSNRPVAGSSPSAPLSLLASVPWSLLLAVIDRALELAHRDGDGSAQADATAAEPAGGSNATVHIGD
jgi:hypothetical protein